MKNQNIKIIKLGPLTIGLKRREKPIPEFEEFAKAWKSFCNEFIKVFKLKKICDFLEKLLKRTQ